MAELTMKEVYESIILQLMGKLAKIDHKDFESVTIQTQVPIDNKTEWEIFPNNQHNLYDIITIKYTATIPTDNKNHHII
jgi:hypothetical protein